MKKVHYITSDAEEFQRQIVEHTDSSQADDKRSRIINDYSGKYEIKGESVSVKGRQVHIDYLPTIDAMLKSTERYANPKDTVGAALFKIEKEHCLFFTDSNDQRLQRVYEENKRQADGLAAKLWKLNDEEYDCQFSHVTASVLSGSFEVVFGQLYGDWRRSLN